MLGQHTHTHTHTHTQNLKGKKVVVAELSRFQLHFPCFSESTVTREESGLFLAMT
jgi:hypothetical protein